MKKNQPTNPPWLWTFITLAFAAAWPVQAKSQLDPNLKTKWTVEGTKLWMENEKNEKQRLFLKGVCYSPTPIGCATFAPGIGDWFYWNFAGIWKDRDLPEMKKQGFNHLRTYFWWVLPPPQDINTWQKKAAEQEQLAKQDKRTFDHMAFLDACYNNGIYVIIGLAVNGGEVFEGGLADQYTAFFKWNAAKIGEYYGKHPAVIGICIGNEQNNASRNSRPEFLGKLGDMAKAFKDNAPDKITMVAFQNDANDATGVLQATVGGKPFPQVYADKFDVWGLNIYAGLDTTLAAFKKAVASQPYARPLIVSEWAVGIATTDPVNQPGPPAGNAKPKEVTDYKPAIAEITKRFGWMADNKDFVVGSEYFEWTDEWHKNYTDPPSVLYTADEASNVKDTSWTKMPVSPPEDAFKPNDDQKTWKTFYFVNNKGQWRKTNGEAVYPTFVYYQEASESKDWPEEMWGLYSVKPVNRDPSKWGPGNRWPNFNENGYVYGVDAITARPTVEALKNAYDTVQNPIEKSGN